MSGVYARFHQATGLEFWDCAVKIETEMWRIIKKFPKSARFTHAVPLYQLAQKMNDEICMANSIFVTNEHELEIRKDIIQRAICHNECLIQRLRRCIIELEVLDIDKMEPVFELLIKESKLLREWRKSTKSAAKQ